MIDDVEGYVSAVGFAKAANRSDLHHGEVFTAGGNDYRVVDRTWTPKQRAAHAVFAASSGGTGMPKQWWLGAKPVRASGAAPMGSGRGSVRGVRSNDPRAREAKLTVRRTSAGEREAEHEAKAIGWTTTGAATGAAVGLAGSRLAGGAKGARLLIPALGLTGGAVGYRLGQSKYNRPSTHTMEYRRRGRRVY